MMGGHDGAPGAWGGSGPPSLAIRPSEAPSTLRPPQHRVRSPWRGLDTAAWTRRSVWGAESTHSVSVGTRAAGEAGRCAARGEGCRSEGRNARGSGAGCCSRGHGMQHLGMQDGMRDAASGMQHTGAAVWDAAGGMRDGMRDAAGSGAGCCPVPRHKRCRCLAAAASPAWARLKHLPSCGQSSARSSPGSRCSTSFHHRLSPFSCSTNHGGHSLSAPEPLAVRPGPAFAPRCFPQPAKPPQGVTQPAQDEPLALRHAWTMETAALWHP